MKHYVITLNKVFYDGSAGLMSYVIGLTTNREKAREIFEQEKKYQVANFEGLFGTEYDADNVQDDFDVLWSYYDCDYEIKLEIIEIEEQE